MKRIKSLLFTLLASLGLLVPLAVPAVVSAQDVNIQQGLCVGSQLSADGTCDDTTQSTAKTGVTTAIKNAINIFSIVVGVIAVIMIIIGGVKYITSGGDAGNVTGAKNTILYAIIGLVVVALSQVIVQFVLGSFA
jgi:hypothetical protein